MDAKPLFQARVELPIEGRGTLPCSFGEILGSGIRMRAVTSAPLVSCVGVGFQIELHVAHGANESVEAFEGIGEEGQPRNHEFSRSVPNRASWRWNRRSPIFGTSTFPPEVRCCRLHVLESRPCVRRSFPPATSPRESPGRPGSNRRGELEEGTSTAVATLSLFECNWVHPGLMVIHQ